MRLALSVLGLCFALPAVASEAPTGFTASAFTASGGPRLFLVEDEIALGLGGQAGYTIPIGFHFGGAANVFVASESGRGGGVSSNASTRILNLMAVAGYDFGFGEDFVLRPMAGAGVVNVNSRACVSAPLIGRTCGGGSDSELGVVTGAEALYRIKALTLGGEAKLTLGPVDGVWVGFNVGVVLGGD